MIQDPEHSRRLAQNLVELLTPYEEELIQLERDTPGDDFLCLHAQVLPTR